MRSNDLERERGPTVRGAPVATVIVVAIWDDEFGKELLCRHIAKPASVS